MIIVCLQPHGLWAWTLRLKNGVSFWSPSYAENRGNTNLLWKGQFLVDELEEIVWNDKAFDNLVLPEGEKELVWDFVESKNMTNYANYDFIPEKGIFFFLCTGNPVLSFCFGLPELILTVDRPRYYCSHVWSTWCRKDIHRRSR
jgi:hypothetical protein